MKKTIEQKNNDTELKYALNVLVHHLRTDDDYRRAWVANIAVSMMDEMTHTIKHHKAHEWSNKGAERFIQTLCRKIEE